MSRILMTKKDDGYNKSPQNNIGALHGYTGVDLSVKDIA